MRPEVFVRLTRLEHAAMLCVAVLVGEIVALGRMPDLELMLLSFIPPFFIEISAFAINDVFDVDTDTENKRLDRPLVSGEAKLEEAAAIAIIAYLIGVGAALFINLPTFVIALLAGSLAFLYSYKLKDMLLVGNIYVALTMAIPFIFGNLVITQSVSSTTLVIAAIAFFTGLGREIIGTVRDMEGDRIARRAATLPMVVGNHLALVLATIFLGIAILLSAVPFLFLATYRNNPNYFVPVIITDVLLLYVAIKVTSDSHGSLSQSRNLTLAALGFGLIAFLLGALYG